MKNDFSFKVVAAAVLTGVVLALFNSARGAEKVPAATPAVATVATSAHP